MTCDSLGLWPLFALGFLLVVLGVLLSRMGVDKSSNAHLRSFTKAQ